MTRGAKRDKNNQQEVETARKEDIENFLEGKEITDYKRSNYKKSTEGERNWNADDKMGCKKMSKMKQNWKKQQI